MILRPGVIFDSRSVILSLAGLFTGGTTTIIACGIAVIARVLIGGAGYIHRRWFNRYLRYCRAALS